MLDRPSVAVLLASYNGQAWIYTQIQSIIESSGVNVHVFVGDDGSSDGTLSSVAQFPGERVTILPGSKTGSAGKNFLNLLSQDFWKDFDYVALSDQDDIWASDKLLRAVEYLKDHAISCYSSDVTAFYPDGSERYIRKSQPQKSFDYLFESGGPGSTFVIPGILARQLGKFLKEEKVAEIDHIYMHDWFIYCFFRHKNIPWHIDQFSGVRYRQHEDNVLGASTGVRSVVDRAFMFVNGWYLKQLIAMKNLLGISHPAAEYVENPTFAGFLRSVPHVFQLRRRKREAILLAIGLLSILISTQKRQ